MKRFSKGFLPCAIISILLILSGIVSYFVRGINFGIDFRPGLIQEVNITGTNIDSVRLVLSGVSGANVKEIGSSGDLFQIRVPDNNNVSANELSDSVVNVLKQSYGEDKVVLNKTDFIGSSFSVTLVRNSVLLLIATLGLIWVYAAIRFHWDMALGAIIAVMHDALIMLVFISWTQMEFTTVTLAAILTIIGYSINATVVILDRVRANAHSINVDKFCDLMDISLTDTFSRSLITTITTMLAVGALYLFTTGSMRDFALALLVGLVSGLYSSLFISSGFITLVRHNWTPLLEVKAVPKFSVVTQK